jgi:hypothetical protein
VSEDDKENENEDDEYESEDENSNDEEMDNKATRNPVQIEGRAGMFKKAISIIERYAARPKYLRNMCLAQFATSYTYQAKPPKKIKFDKNGNSRGRSSKKIFNQDTFLPTHISLKDGLGIMRLRKEPAVLRIHTSKHKDGHEKHYSEMVLFSPWIDCFSVGINVIPPLYIFSNAGILIFWQFFFLIYPRAKQNHFRVVFFMTILAF